MSDNAFDIVVIGAGPGGYVAALKAAQEGAKVAIIEKGQLGGTCLNVGCIPSKALLASAELLHRIERAAELGVGVTGPASFDWPKIQARKDKVIATLRSGVKGLLTARKATILAGRATLAGMGKVRVELSKGGTEELAAKNVIVATGSTPSRIPGWPTDPNVVCTSDEALHWPTLPKRLLIVGGGVIGCEFACMMRQYGLEVTVVEMLPGLLPEMEPQLGTMLAEIFIKRGIGVLTGVKVDNLQVAGGEVVATISGGKVIKADKVLVATGRRPATAEIGLESVGLATDHGFLRVNDRMETAVKGCYCIGDANGRCLLAHAASAQGVTAVENALGNSSQQTAPVPGAVYTFPEIGSIGLTSKQARENGIPVAVGMFPLAALGKALAVGETAGFAKVLRGKDDGKLLGVHVLGAGATEIVAAATVLLGAKASAKDLAEAVIAHPTFSESIKEAAEDSLGRALHLPPRRAMKAAATTEEVA